MSLLEKVYVPIGKSLCPYWKKSMSLLEKVYVLYHRQTRIKPMFLPCRNQVGNQVDNQVSNQAINQGRFCNGNASTTRYDIASVRWASRPAALLGTVALALRLRRTTGE